MQPAEERPDFLIGDRTRREAAAELALELGEAYRLSEQLHQRVFFRREVVMLEGERIFDDPGRRARHLDGRGDQVGPQPQHERAIGGCERRRHCGMRNSDCGLGGADDGGGGGADGHFYGLAGAEAAVAIVDLGPHADLAGDRIDLGADEDDFAVERRGGLAGQVDSESRRSVAESCRELLRPAKSLRL